MATRIIEYGGEGLIGYGFPVVPADQFVTAQPAMTATGTSAQSAAFNAATSLICVQSEEAIYVRADANPTATTDHYRITVPTGLTGEQWFSVKPGWKVAIRT